MMADIVSHPQTSRQIKSFMAKPSHALLLTGPVGSGKHTLALWIAAELINAGNADISALPYVRIIAEPDSKSIGIEAVRQLEHFLALKVPGKSATDRVVVIEESDKMTLEAQNALLKTLEEPPKGTVVVLTASSQHALLPTVRSRTQHIPVLATSKEQLADQFSPVSQDEFNLAYSISGGRIGLMHDLLVNNDHPLRQAATKARVLLGKSVYERLLEVDALSKDPAATRELLYILQQMASIQLRADNNTTAGRWQSILDATYQAEAALIENTQAKLTLTNMMLTL
jgi:energy-coupling factor transporter ATP-binding protein EcfA2